MKKWLCVLNYHTGAAELENVSLVEASTSFEAREICLRDYGLVDSAISSIRAFDTEDMPSVWHYYN